MKTAIITGGTGAIGKALVAEFSKDYRVVFTYNSNEDDAMLLSDKYGATAVKCDISNPAEICRLEPYIKGCSLLVNNAGIAGKTAKILTDDCNEENFDRVIATNLKGVFLFGKAAAAQFVRQGGGGKIINIASVGGLVGGPGVVAYGASKAGVISLSKTMANEFARDGITVVAICPGYVVTPLNEDVFLDEYGNHTKIYELSAKNTALRRLGSIEEIAGPVTAIACDCFSYMTGTTIVLDGGQTIGR